MGSNLKNTLHKIESSPKKLVRAWGFEGNPHEPTAHKET